MNKQVAASYILENFEPSDRVAVVLLNKRTGAALQRIASAERVASAEYQAWLRHMNAQGYDVYMSMNALASGAQRRTKQDVECIRHVFLDFDENGTAAVEALLRREDIPEPNYLLNSSPDKWQVIWKIQGCSKAQAEKIERALVQDTGADLAVIDVARVLRLPGFYNHKYAHPHLITVESRSGEVSTVEQFPQIAPDARQGRPNTARANRLHGELTQSERDWAYVREALRQGVDPEILVVELKMRRGDKFNPDDYARRTVEKAAASLKQVNSSADDRETEEPQGLQLER